VLNLLRELQNEFELGYLFIAHDLAVVRHLSHRIIVLYRGRIMEEGPAATVYGQPVHPYTQTLLEAAPVPDPELQRRPRPVKWCTRLSASSSLDVYAAAAIAITSSGSAAGSASAFAIESALM
jgi:ABC-type oligopeptide transport system ATPase subunit